MNIEKMSILLVEDEPITAMMEKMELEKYGYSIHHVITGEKAVQTVNEGSLAIDVILMDIDLGEGIDGTQAAALILQQKDIPIVFLSSHTEPEIVEKTEKITSYGYVVKNSGIVVLDASIKMALKLFNAKTACKETEEEAKSRERFLNKIFDILPIGLWFTDKEGTLIRGNPAGIKIWGAEPKVAIQDYGVFTARYYPEGKEIEAEEWALAKTIRNKITIEDELLEIDAFDGKKKIVVNYTAPVLDDNGDLLGAIVINRDITENIKAEKELAESAERFKALHNASFGGITIHDKGIILECNQGLSEMFGYSINELIGMDGLLLIAPEHRERVIHNITTGYEQAYEADGLRKDGTQFPMRLEARNIPYKGKMVRTVEFRDLTEAKKAEQEIEKQLAEKEILLREIHHRVKNNISNIESFLQLQSNTTSNIEAKDAIQGAISRVQAMRILYDRLLLSKDLREISMKSYIEAIIDSLFAVYADQDTITIEKDISDFNISAKQAISIGIIVNELLTNVFKYAFINHETGTISIHIQKKETTLTITIQDNGIGIDERLLQNKSPGFGLTIVTMLAEQLGGTYHCSNEHGTKSVIEIAL